MLTRCPACAVWFRVRAEHLSAAAGYVTCGACDNVFNALATLIEEAPPPASLPPEPVPAPDIWSTPSTAAAAAAYATSPGRDDAAPSEDSLPVPPRQASGAVAEELRQSEPQGAPERATDWARYALPEQDYARPWAAETHSLAQRDAASAAPWRPVESKPAELEPLPAPAAERLAGSEIEFVVAPQRDERVAADHGEFTTAFVGPNRDAREAPKALDVHDAFAVRDDAQPLPRVVDARASHIDERMTARSDDAWPEQERESTTTGAGETIRDAGDESDPEPPADEPAVRKDERQVPSTDDLQSEPDHDPIPELLRNEIIALEREQQRTPRRGLLWGLGCTALVLVFVAQLLYVYRDRLIAHWPAAAPLVADLCAEFGCPAIDATIASPVELLARDVREHPQYHDALLVNATLVNSSASAAPFPVLELVLHDATGGIIGARRFAPEEYLDHSIAIEAGMSPAQPVYIVIELGGSAAAATSFEFSFM